MALLFTCKACGSPAFYYIGNNWSVDKFFGLRSKDFRFPDGSTPAPGTEIKCQSCEKTGYSNAEVELPKDFKI